MGLVALWVMAPVLLLEAVLVRPRPRSGLTWELAGAGWRGKLARVGVYGVLLLAQPAQHVFATLAPDVLGPGANVGSSVLFPLSLSLLLYLYATRRPGEFLRVILLIVGSNALIGAVACALRAGWFQQADWGRYEALWTRQATWGITLGTASTIAAALVMVGLTSRLGQKATTGASRVALPLLIGLLVDSGLFSLVLARSKGWEHYWFLFAGQAVSKSLSGIVYATALSAILRPAGLEQLRKATPPWEFLKTAVAAATLLNVSGLITAFSRAKSSFYPKSFQRKESALMSKDFDTRTDRDLTSGWMSSTELSPAITLGPDTACPEQRVHARRQMLRTLALHWDELLRCYNGRWVALDQDGTAKQVAGSFDELWGQLSPDERTVLHVQHVAPEAAPVRPGRAR